jgi:hypothetical protein
MGKTRDLGRRDGRNAKPKPENTAAIGASRRRKRGEKMVRRNTDMGPMSETRRGPKSSKAGP